MFEPKLTAKKRYTTQNFSPHSPHAKIVSIIDKNWRVLDVGCGSGSLGKYLKENKNCYVVGIEIDEDLAQIAKIIYDDIIVGDVEKMEEIPYPYNYFDAIIFADVLEHLRRPDLVLIRFKKYLKPDGVVISSIPNVARIEIRLKLLFGKFEYEETGIMDKTHLRFFTLSTAKRLFKDCGYDIIKIDYTGLASKYKILGLFPSMFAYQFIIVARPK